MERFWQYYKIKGRHGETNRLRTVEVFAHSQEMAFVKATEKNIVRDLQVIETTPIPPATEAQISYAKDLGLTIPEQATKFDLHDILDKAINKDGTPNSGLFTFAYDRGFFLTAYIGKRALYNLVFNSLSDLDKVAFFVFSLYRWLSDDREANLDIHQYRQYFYAFAQDNYENEKFMKSLRENYTGEDLRFFGTLNIIKDNWESTYTGGSTQTYAYKCAKQFLKDNFGLEHKRSKTLHNDKHYEQKYSYEQQEFNVDANSQNVQSVEDNIEMPFYYSWQFFLALIVLSFFTTWALLIVAIVLFCMGASRYHKEREKRKGSNHEQKI